MSALVIDAFEFCRLKEHRNGETLVAELPRLAAESEDSTGAIEWSLEGGKDALGYPLLKLAVSGSVKLICQRCLQPLDVKIASQSHLVLASDDAAADEIEALLDDESLEVIVGSKELNLISLMEDEALLALPVSPKHDACPSQELMVPASLPEKESPFSILKNLKKN